MQQSDGEIPNAPSYAREREFQKNFPIQLNLSLLRFIIIHYYALILLNSGSQPFFAHVPLNREIKIGVSPRGF